MLYDIKEVNTMRKIDIAPLGGDMAQDITLFLNRATRLAVKQWWKKLHFKKYIKSVYLPLKNCLEGQLVNASNYVRVLSTVIKFDLLNEDIVGQTKQAVQDKCIKLIRSLAHSHTANSNNGWNISAVSASTAIAGFLIWDKLNSMDKLLLINMLEYEANKVIEIKTPFQYSDENRKDSGNKSRVVSEFINVLNIAIAMMPNNVRTFEWRIKFKELQAVAYASESDGKRGWNTLDDGIIMNGASIDVHCMNAIVYNFDAITIASLAGERLDECLKTNAMHVYNAYNNLYLSRNNKEWLPLYHRSYTNEPKAQLNLPKAHTDTPYKYANYYANDVMAYCYGYTEGTPREWARVRMRKLLYMQSRHSNYRIYRKSAIGHRKERESSAAKMVSMAFLALYLKATDQQ